jgi:hypothetical protein
VKQMALFLNQPSASALFQTRRLTYSALLAQEVEHDFTSVYVIDW